MVKFNLNNFSLNIFIFSLLTFCNLTATSTDELISNPFQGLACAVINCGEGSCVGSNSSVLGFDCVCNSGWKKIQIGNFTFPPCLVPNCTVNLSCSNVSTPPSTPSPCGWCGDGTCAANGTGYTCQCPPGSANLFDNSSLPCLQQCSIGGDCNGLGLVLPFTPSSPPPPTKSGSTAVGPTQASNNSSKLGTLIIILLVAATIQTWF
ncbi:hypothetical protein Dsin_013645 [Dipteronia sinensis]|uniref:EGF-like domain-containing protein n=1 Tax=Dipteronia sinensis TaxID=43782 RepID=A0AAE0ALB5_9ROSI|nr:hypothetical protein Dsin_013645 [Dipteronia sinensis]